MSSAKPAPVVARQDSTDTSGTTYSAASAAEDAKWAMTHEKVRRAVEAQKKLANGSVSPFDTEVGQTAGVGEARFRLFEKDPRMEFEGSFFPTFVETPMGATQPQRDGDFLSRGDAMAYAYHFATALDEDARNSVVEMAWVNANSDTTRDASGRIYGVSSDGRISGDSKEGTEHGTFHSVMTFHRMERQAASLANLFSLDTASVTNAAYDGTYQGFSLSHGTLGKIMDVSADGQVTLYDAQGNAYSAAEYSAANIDGGIPELRNDLLRQADRQMARA
ncbi:MAG: hypothetical protein QM682_13355 [Paracoccus sp. (in: a-proteobacteria)]|uniref:hypothetical protein n=1 Tax=Paracoccus sp. TaxID=267 RepID=UPI0039E5F8A5